MSTTVPCSKDLGWVTFGRTRSGKTLWNALLFRHGAPIILSASILKSSLEVHNDRNSTP